MKSGKSISSKYSAHRGRILLSAGLIAVLMIAYAFLPMSYAGRVYASGSQTTAATTATPQKTDSSTTASTQRILKVKFPGSDTSKPVAKAVFIDSADKPTIVDITYSKPEGSTVDLAGKVADGTYKNVYILLPGCLTYSKSQFNVPNDLSSTITLMVGDINRAVMNGQGVTEDASAQTTNATTAATTAADNATSDNAITEEPGTTATTTNTTASPSSTTAANGTNSPSASATAAVPTKVAEIICISDDAVYMNAFGDYSLGDGKINAHDHAALTEVFLAVKGDAKYVDYADFNKDGNINAMDRSEIGHNFGKTASDYR